jgi:hypothetical protein
VPIQKWKKDWVWRNTPIISALRRLKQEDLKFKTSLGYIEKKKRNAR